MPRELKDTKHNAYHRVASMKYYNSVNGRLKARLKYLRNKHKDNPEMMAIVNDPDMEIMDKIETIKIQEFKNKIDKLREKKPE